jgi:hypothetical protein
MLLSTFYFLLFGFLLEKEVVDETVFRMVRYPNSKQQEQQGGQQTTDNIRQQQRATSFTFGQVHRSISIILPSPSSSFMA